MALTSADTKMLWADCPHLASIKYWIEIIKQEIHTSHRVLCMFKIMPSLQVHEIRHCAADTRGEASLTVDKAVLASLERFVRLAGPEVSTSSFSVFVYSWWSDAASPCSPPMTVPFLHSRVQLYSEPMESDFASITFRFPLESNQSKQSAAWNREIG